MHPILRRSPVFAAALLAAGLMAGCATRAPLDTVEDARTSVNSAAANADVVRLAPLELKSATDTLARADKVWADDRDAAEANARSAQAAQMQAMSAEQRAAQHEARVRALEAQLRDIEAQQTERGLLVSLGDVLFAFNKAELSAQATPRLDKLANFLRQFPDRKLIIEGHTDSVGGDSYNQELSERRAQAVQSALVQRGVTPDRITARGYGKTYPVAENGSAEGRAMNRRVEIVIADDKGNLRGR